MFEYHKIETVWKRDPATNYKHLIWGAWARLEFAYLSSATWTWTEKVDGTNIRVQWDGDTTRFRGKTDNAQIPPRLLDRLNERFDGAKLEGVFPDATPVCLYGEGFGARIQKGGGNYIADGVDFVLFDVRVGEYWLRRPDVEDVASKLDCPVVPIVGTGPLRNAIDLVRDRGLKSAWGDFAAEGLVMRPAVELTDRNGRRVITKIKARDFR